MRTAFPTAPQASAVSPPDPLAVGVDASRAFAERPTGTENYATHVIRELALDQRLRLTLYTRSSANDARVRRGMAQRESEPQITLRHIPAPRLWTHTRLGWEVARRSPDVLFIPAHVMPLVTRPPAVVTVHDLGHRMFPDAHTRSQRWYLEWSTRRHARGATRLVADSQSTRRDLERLYGVDPRRIVVAPLGVDDWFRPAPSAAIAGARKAMGVADGRRYLLHVGSLQPRKNLVRLVLAFAEIATEHADLDLVLAGARGWGPDDAAAHVRKLGLQGRVHVTGYLAREWLAAAYTGAVATALPSLYEGFGLSAAESLACGTPVAGSNTSSVPEVVGDAGLLFDPLSVAGMAAALHQLASDPDLRDRLGRAGAERASQFSWAACSATIAAALVAAAAPDTRRGAE